MTIVIVTIYTFYFVLSYIVVIYNFCFINLDYMYLLTKMLFAGAFKNCSWVVSVFDSIFLTWYILHWLQFHCCWISIYYLLSAFYYKVYIFSKKNFRTFAQGLKNNFLIIIKTCLTLFHVQEVHFKFNPVGLWIILHFSNLEDDCRLLICWSL